MKMIFGCLVVIIYVFGPGVPDDYPPEPPKGVNGPCESPNEKIISLEQ